MNQAAPQSVKPAFELKGWHVLVIMLVLFGGVFAVNGYMVFHAYSTFPGEVVAKPYEEGLGFNADIHRRAAARSLGWRAALADSVSDGRLTLTLSVHDRVGAAVVGLKPVGQLTRTVTAEGGKSLHFVETTPGVYVATLAPLSGLWDLNVKAPAGDHAFELEQRLVWQ